MGVAYAPGSRITESIPLRLRQGHGLRQVHDPVAGVVDQHVDAAALRRYFAHRAFHRGVLRDVKFHGLQREGFTFGKFRDFTRRCCVAAVHIAHRGEDLIILARECFGDQPAEAAARAGNENNLLWNRHGVKG